VFASHGIAVHCRAVKGGDVDGALDVFSQDAPVGFSHINQLRSTHGPQTREDCVQRVVGTHQCFENRLLAHGYLVSASCWRAASISARANGSASSRCAARNTSSTSIASSIPTLLFHSASACAATARVAPSDAASPRRS